MYSPAGGTHTVNTYHPHHNPHHHQAAAAAAAAAAANNIGGSGALQGPYNWNFSLEPFNMSQSLLFRNPQTDPLQLPPVSLDTAYPSLNTSGGLTPSTTTSDCSGSVTPSHSSTVPLDFSSGQLPPLTGAPSMESLNNTDTENNTVLSAQSSPEYVHSSSMEYSRFYSTSVGTGNTNAMAAREDANNNEGELQQWSHFVDTNLDIEMLPLKRAQELNKNKIKWMPKMKTDKGDLMGMDWLVHYLPYLFDLSDHLGVYIFIVFLSLFCCPYLSLGTCNQLNTIVFVSAIPTDLVVGGCHCFGCLCLKVVDVFYFFNF